MKHIYRATNNFLGNIKKENKWRKHVATGARSLNHVEVKAIAQSTIRGKDGRVVLPWLRDKLITMTEIHIGYHPVDVFRMSLANLEDVPTHRNRESGCIQPLMKIVNIKTKEHDKCIRNWYVCGCAADHDSDNDGCEYGLMKKLLHYLPVTFAEESLWWNTKKGGWCQKFGRMQRRNISKAIQRVNIRCGICPTETLSGNMGRKTCITLNRQFFNHDKGIVMDKVHHKTEEINETYVDREYCNEDRESVLQTAWQDFEQDRYFPIAVDSVPRIVCGIRQTVRETQTSIDQLKKEVVEAKQTLWNEVEQVRKTVDRLMTLSRFFNTFLQTLIRLIVWLVVQKS